VLPPTLDSTIDLHPPAAAAALTRGLPRDQALGLRLMAMARAAAGVHLGRVALGDAGAGNQHTAQESADMTQLLRSQAWGLVEALKAHGQDARATEGGAVG
jgi:hypothetical protein